MLEKTLLYLLILHSGKKLNIKLREKRLGMKTPPIYYLKSCGRKTHGVPKVSIP